MGPKRSSWSEAQVNPVFQPLPSLVEGMIAIQNREHQGFTSTPTREPMRGMRRSIIVATSRRRKTPRTNGQCATGCIGCTDTAMMHRLSSSPDSIIAERSREAIVALAPE